MNKKFENYSNYNLTYSKKIIKFEPKNLRELSKIKSKKDFFFFENWKLQLWGQVNIKQD